MSFRKPSAPTMRRANMAALLDNTVIRRSSINTVAVDEIATFVDEGGDILRSRPVTVNDDGTTLDIATALVMQLRSSGARVRIVSDVDDVFLDVPTGKAHYFNVNNLQHAIVDGNGVTLPNAGDGLKVKEGTDATMGVATLVAGAVTVNTTKVTASSRIQLTVQSLGTVLIPTDVAVTARTPGTSFTITSADATDTSVVAWIILEPGP